MKITHNKLVRDNIPQIIESCGKSCKTTILSSSEYIAALKAKLLEESKEVVEASDLSSLIGELADVMEVVQSIESYYEIDPSVVEDKRISKGSKNGRFKDRIFLEYVIEDDKE